MGIRISTGIIPFDELLEGGLELNSITTIFGPSGSGKTNICMEASIRTVKNGLRVVYLDGNRSFSVERLRQLTSDYDLILANVLFLRPDTFSSQHSSIRKIEKMALELQDRKKAKGIGLIVADALTHLYRLDLSKKKKVSKVNKELIDEVNSLEKTAKKARIPIIITTPVYSDFESKEDVKMVGGDILKNNSSTIIELLKLAGANRKAVIRKHRSIAEGKEVGFRIQEQGVV